MNLILTIIAVVVVGGALIYLFFFTEPLGETKTKINKVWAEVAERLGLEFTPVTKERMKPTLVGELQKMEMRAHAEEMFGGNVYTIFQTQLDPQWPTDKTLSSSFSAGSLEEAWQRSVETKAKRVQDYFTDFKIENGILIARHDRLITNANEMVQSLNLVAEFARFLNKTMQQ